MATEADIPESVLHKNSEGVDTYLTTAQFEKTILESLPLPAELKKTRSQLTQHSEETHECWEESKNMDVASKTQVEIAKDVINNNFGVLGDASFLASPSASIVSNEELKPSEIEILENAEHLDKSQEFGVTEETKEEDEVIVEENQKADQDDKDHTVETTSQVAETGEPKLKVEEGETVKNEINLDQNVELILNQQDTVTGSPQSIEEETKGLEKDEEGGKLEEKITKLSSKEVLCMPETTLDHSNEASIHSPDLRINKDVQSVAETGDAFNYKFERITMIDEREAGATEQDEQKEVSGTTCKEQSQNANESSKQEREAPIENEMQDKESSITPFITEAVEVCSRQVDNAQVVCPEHVAKESPIEVTKQTEFLAETAQVAGTAGSNVHDAEISEQKHESSSASGEHDEDIHCKVEGLDITDAAIGETRDTEGSSLVEAEDISTSKRIHGEEPRGLESTKHEDYSEASLSQNEPEKEKPQEHSNGISEEREDAAAIISIEEEGQIKDLEESIKQKEKEQNISLTDSDKKTEGTVEFPNNDTNNSHVMSLLVEQVREAESGKISEVSEPEFHEKIQKSIEASTNEEKHVQAESEADQSKEKENLLHTSAEGIAPTEIILETSESVKKQESSEAEDTGEIIIKEAEITDTEIQKCTTESHGTEEGMVLDDVTVKVDDSDRAEMDSPISDVGIPEEETLKSIGEDKSHEPKSTEGDLKKEQNTEGDVTLGGSDSIDSSQENIKVSENLNEEESSTEIQKEGYSSDLPQENIQEDATNTLKDHEDEAEKSQTEIVEELETAGTGESIAHEGKEDVEKFVDASSVKQEGEEHGPMDASVKEDEIEDTFSTEVLEDNDENAVKDTQIEVESKDKEDQQKTVQRDEQGEKLDNLPHVTPEENETELSTENNTNIVCTEGEETIQKEETSETETKELAKNVDNKDNSEKEVLETTSMGQETAGASASVVCETKEDVEKSVDPSLVKQGDDHLEEVKDQGPTEASAEENKVEDTFPTEAVEDDEDNAVNATEIIEVASKDGTEIEPSSVYDTNIARMEGEENIQKLEETPETEKKEPAKNVDSTDDSQKELLETTSVGKEIREQVLGETDDQDTAELSSSSLGDEIANESSKEHEKLQKLKEDDTYSEIKEQNRETYLTEEHDSVEPQKEASEEEKLPEEETEGRLIKYNSDSVKDETVSDETHLNEAEPDNEEQIKSYNTTPQEKAPASSVNSDIQSDSVPAEIVKEEACLKIAEDNEELELVKSSNIAFQEKVLTSSDDIEEQPESISTEIVSKQKGFKEAKPDNEEHFESSNIALEEKGLASIGDIVPDSEKEVLETSSAGQETRDEILDKIHEQGLAQLSFSSLREETDQSKEKENLLHTSAEGIAPTEIILETSESIKKPESSDAEDTGELIKKEAEITDTKIQKCTTKSHGTEEGTVLDGVTVKVDDRDRAEMDSPISDVGIPEEETLKSIGEDKIHEPKNTEGDINKEPITEGDITLGGPESIDSSEENLNEEESSTKIQKEGYSSSDLAQENIQEDATKTLNDHEDEAEKSQTEIVEELETAGTGENIAHEGKEDVEKFVDASSVKQEGEEQGPIDASVKENEVGDTFSTEVGKDNDENAIKDTQIEVVSKDKEDQQQTMQRDEQGEKLDNLPHVTPEENETELSTENNTNIACTEGEETIQKEEISETETKELAKNLDNKEKSEKEVLETTSVDQETREHVSREIDEHGIRELTSLPLGEVLETAGAGASVACETKEDVDKSVDPSSEKQGDDQLEEVKDQGPTEASAQENKAEDTFPTEVEDDEDNTVNATEIIEVASPDGEDQQKTMQKDEPGEKLETLPHVTPKATETEPSSEYDTNIARMKAEENIQKLEETPETEKKEPAKSEDSTDDSEKEVFETTSVGKEIREQVLGETDEQDTAELSSSSLGDEIANESSKECEKLQKLEEDDTHSEIKEQNRETYLTEEHDSAEPQKEASEEEKIPEEETEGRLIKYNSDSVKDETVSEETHLNEAEPDNEEQIKSYNITPQDKAPASTVNSDIQSDSVPAEIVKEEACLKIAEDNEELELVKSSNIAFQEKVLTSSDDIEEQPESISTEIVSKQKGFKEAKPDNEEHFESSNIALEEKGLASSEDISVQPHCMSTEIVSEEARLNKVQQDKEEHVQSSNFAPEEKGLANSADIELQSDSVLTEIVREETGSKKAEPDNQEKESSSIAPEEKDQASIEDIVPDSEEVLETSSTGQDTRDEILDKIHEKGLAQLSFSSLREETDQSKEKENLLHTSAEGIAPTEIILETSEKPERSEAEDTGELIKKEAEITDRNIQKCTTKSHGTEEGTVLDDVTVKVDDSDRAEMDSPISDVGIPEEETLKSIGEDKSHEPKNTEGDINKEPITEGDVTLGGPESIDSSEENLNEEESSTKIQKEGYSSSDLAQENIQEDATKTLNDHEDEAEKSQTEIVEELETAGTGENIAHEGKEDVEKFVDASSVKQEGEEQGPIDASVKENEVGDTFSTEVGKDNDENAVKDTQIEVVSKDKEDQQQTMQRDEQGEKLDNLPHVTLEENETELSTENNTNIACTKGEETSETETKELAKNVDNKEKSEKEVLQPTSVGQETREHVSREIDEHGIAELTSMPLGEVLETAGAGASVACETKEDVDKSVDPASVKQGNDQLEEVKDQGPTEASAQENKVEDTFPTEVVEDDEDNTVNATEIIEVASPDGEDQQKTMQKDEPGEKLENLPHVTPEGTETEPSSEYDTNIACMEGEENIQKLEETPETEKKEPAKKVDSTDDSEKELLETTSVGKEIREQVLGETDDQDTAELSSSSLGNEIANESSKEREKLQKLKEDDTHSGIKEQNRETYLTEEHDSVEPQKEASEEEKLPEEETEGRLIKYNSDSVKDETVSEETHLNEAEPDNEEQIKSYNITPQEKAPASSVNSEVQSDSVPAEIGKEEACLKIAEDNEELELVKSSNIAFQEKVLTSNDDIEEQPETISTEIVSKQKGLKEAKPDNEEHFESSNIALEEKGLASSEDISVQPHCISIEIVSEEARLNEVQQDEEERVQSSNFAPEEKGLANSEDIELQSDSVLTEIVREETGSKKAEPDNQEKESSSIAPEEKDQASIEDIVPDSEKEVLDTSSTGQETRDEILDEIHEQGLAQLSFSSLRDETVEESSKEHEFDSVTDGIVSEETHLKEEEQENNEQVKSYEIASEEKSLAGGADTEVQSVSVSTEIVNKENRFEEVKPDNEEQPKISNVALEEKGLATSKDIEVQADSVSTEIVSEKKELEKAELDNEEKVKSSIISSEEKGLTSTEDSRVQPDNVSTEIVREETGLKAAEPENEEQVTHSNINIEKGVASSEDVEVKPDSVSTEIVSKETRLVEAESDSQEQVGSSSIASEEKGLANSEDLVPDSENEVLATTRVSKEIRKQVLEETDEKETAELSSSYLEDETVNESSKEHEKLQKLKEDDTHSEFNKQNREPDFTEEHDSAEPRKEALEEETEGKPTKYNSDSVTTGTINEETHLKEAEPDNEEQIKVFNITPQEEVPANSVDSEEQSGSVPTEIVKEETCMEAAEDNDELELVKSSNIALQEKVLTNSDDIEEQPESISTEIVSEQKVYKEAKSDTEEHVESSNVALEEKGLASSEDVSVQPHCISAEIVSEEARLKLAEQDDEEHVQRSNLSPEEKGLANSDDIEVQSDSVLTETDGEEIRSKKTESDNQEQVESLGIAPEEKGRASTEDIVPDSEKEVLETFGVEQETRDEILDEFHEQDPLELSFSSLREETVEESSKEHDFESATAGTVSEETRLQGAEPENKEQDKSYDIAPKQKSLASSANIEVQSVSVTTEIVNEETGVEEVEPENVEHAGISNVALEEKDLATSKDIEVQADSVSTEIVSEKTGWEIAEPDNEEQVKNSNIYFEEKGEASSEDVEVKPDYASTEIESEKTRSGEAESESQEQVGSSSIASEEKGLANSEDIVPDSEKVVLETSSVGQETRDKILDETHELSSLSLREETVEEKWHEFAKLINSHINSEEQEFDSATAGTVGEETRLKEAEPENKEQDKSNDVAHEDRSLASGANIEVQSVSVSTEIMNEETGFNEAKPENEEHAEISNFALEEKGLTTSNDIEVQADSVSIEIVSEKTGLEIAEQDSEEQVKSSVISSEEKSLVSSEDSRVQPDSVSTEVIIEETELKATELENEEQITKSNISFEEKGVASSEDVVVQPDLASVSNEIVSEETRSNEADSDSQEQVQSLSIAPGGKGLASCEDIVLASEKEVLKSTSEGQETRDKVFAKIHEQGIVELSSSSLGEETVEESSKEHDFDPAAAGIVSEETHLKEAEPENKEKVKSYDIAAGEKSLACSEVIEAQSVSASTEIMNVETGFEEAKPDNEEHDKIYNVALEEKSLATSKDVKVQPDSVSTETVSEKTGLEIAEPDNEEEIKSSIISPEEMSLTSSEDCRVQSDSVSTEVVSEERGLKATELENEDHVTNSNIEEKGVASSEEVEVQAASVSTVIVSEETGLKEAESDGPEQAGSSSVVPQEKGLASSEDIVPDSTSTKVLSEETKLEVAEPDNERQDKSSDVAPGGNNLETNVDTEQQFNSLSTVIVYGETSLKGEELDNKEQVRSCDSAPTEESQVSSIEVEVQSESVLTEIGSEEIGLKRAEPANEEQVKIVNIASEERGLARSLDSEEKSDSILTRSVEAEADTKEHARSYDIAPEEKGLQSSLDIESAEIVSEDTKDARTSNEQVQSYGNAPEDMSLESNADIEVQSKSVSDRMVSEETDLNKTGADNNEQIKSLAIGVEETGSGRFEVQEEKCPNSEENEENLTISDTPLDDRSKHNLEDSSGVTSTEHELITTKASERSDEITAIDGAQSENKKSPIIEPTEEEKMLQKEDESKQKDESMESSATAKEIAREEIQKERELEMNLPPEITSDKSSSKSEAVKSSEKEEASDVAYQSEVHKLETLRTEDNSVAEVENAAVESEVDNIINNKYLTKENLESADTDWKLAQSSEAVTGDQAEETLLVPKKTQTEQNEDSVHGQNCESVTQQTLGENFEGAKEIKVEEEPKLLADSLVNEIQSPNEIIKDVILTEVHEGVERADERRDTEEQVMDGERNLQELHPVSTLDEKLYKEKEVEEPKLVSVSQDIDETRLIPTVEKMDTKEIKEASQTEDERLHEEKEVEETKLVSVTHDVDETRLIPTVEKIDMKEINEASQTVCTSKYTSVEAVNEVELRNEQALSDELSKEQLQEPSSTAIPKEEKDETSTSDKIEEESIKEVDKQVDEKIEDSSATHLQKEEANEPKLPELAAEKLGIQETEDNKTAPETVSKSICEIIHDNSKDDIITKQDASVGISAEQVEVLSSALLPKKPELETFVIVDKSEDENTKELEMLDNISGSFSTEASVETCLKKEDSMDLKFGKMASENLSAEEIIEASDAVSNSNSQSIKVVTEDSIIIDETVTAEISKDQLQVSLPTLLPEEQEPDTTIAFKKVEEESIEAKMLDREDTEDSSATKTAEEAQKEEPRELKVSDPFVKKLSGDHSEEEIKEIPETALSSNSLSNEVVAEDKMITCQTSPEKTSAMQVEDGTTTTTAKEMEEVQTKKVEMPSYENRKDDSSQKPAAEVGSQKEEPKKLEISASTVEMWDRCKVEEDIIEASEASNLNIETSEEACDFQSKKAESQEAFTRIESTEIIENHLKIAASDLGTEGCQFDSKIEAKETIENEISEKGVQSTEISQEKGSLGIEKSHEITQDIKQPEESSHATSKEQTPTPADCDESTGTKITTTDRDVPRTIPDPIEETSQRAEPKETKVYAEIKGDESGREKEVDDSIGKTTEIESKISLSELMQSPTRETTQVAERSSEEKDPNSKEAEQNQKLHEEKDHQEEEEEDHDDEDHPDAPILVHASGDVDVKTKHKKSHSIFSGVGSKVKQSISKVKKAITGKSSSHSKTLPSS